MITLHSKDFTTKYGTINSLCEAFIEEERNGAIVLTRFAADFQEGSFSPR